MAMFVSAIQPWSLIEAHRPPSVTSWSIRTHPDSGDNSWTFSFPDFTFRLRIATVNTLVVNCQVRDETRLVPRKWLDSTREDVRGIIDDAVSAGVPPKDVELEVAILQALERVAELERVVELRERPARTSFSKGWSAGEISDWNEVVANPFGLDVTTIRDTASAILDKTPEQLVEAIPKAWRVIHMESILRPEFVRRFQAYQTSLRNELDHVRGLNHKLAPHSRLEGRTRAQLPRQDIIEDLATPRVTYHGTPLKSVASIVRYGFKMPGRVVDGKVIASPRSGIAFNRGIYSSQEPYYAMSYAAGQNQHTPVGLLPSMRLFVCATVMGRTYRGQWSKVHGPLVEGYDSHFDGNFEYIVHDERAMLPCYVIHLDLGSAEAKKVLSEAQQDPTLFYQQTQAKQKQENKQHPRLATKHMAPGDLKREREARKAAASKWFPYGFGSASGTSFVIEEVGEISDDEEEYGDWQVEKHAFKHGDDGAVLDEDEGYYEYWDENGNQVRKKKGLFLDQYQQVLH